MDVLLVRSFSFSYFSSYKITSIVYEQAKARWNIYRSLHTHLLQCASLRSPTLKKMAKKIQKNLDNDVIITSEEALLLSLAVIDKILVVIIL